MTRTGRAKNATQQTKGKLKETAGRVNGNERLRAEGEVDQLKGTLGQATEKVRDGLEN